MIGRIHRIAIAAIGVLFVALSTVPVDAANLFELNFWLSGPRYDGVVPACDMPVALGRIQSRFATTESRFWQSGLRIDGFERVQEIAFRPWASQTIPRRFCSATALMSDGVRRPIYYWIGEDTGFVGASWGVEWCVVGVDRSWAYNPACKMAQP